MKGPKQKGHFSLDIVTYWDLTSLLKYTDKIYTSKYL